jgi:putative peptide zinc metalloprotease protein
VLGRYDEQWPADRARADVIREELAYVTEQIGEMRRRMADLTVRAATDGTFVVAVPEDLPGRFVRKGELLGYSVEPETVTVRTVVPQAAIDLVRQRTTRVDVRLAERLDEVVPAVILRAVPAASEQLPTMALGAAGGGQIAVDPRDQHGVTAIERVFQVDLELPVRSRFLNIGGRAYVRFDHGREPLLVQWYLATRQLFLARFNV